MNEKQNPYEPTTEISPPPPVVMTSEELRLRENATNIFASGIVGLMAPVVAIYAIVFLLRNRRSFPRKRLAIIGTCLHCIWAPIWIYWVVI